MYKNLTEVSIYVIEGRATDESLEKLNTSRRLKKDVSVIKLISFNVGWWIVQAACGNGISLPDKSNKLSIII